MSEEHLGHETFALAESCLDSERLTTRVMSDTHPDRSEQLESGPVSSIVRQ